MSLKTDETKAAEPKSTLGNGKVEREDLVEIVNNLGHVFRVAKRIAEVLKRKIADNKRRRQPHEVYITEVKD